MFDLDDVRWELGRFGKLNVRHGKGSRRKGPKARINLSHTTTSRYAAIAQNLLDDEPSDR
jgi:hypothetical protein